jgi:hypothetical protein
MLPAFNVYAHRSAVAASVTDCYKTGTRIGYDRFTKEEGRAWQDSVTPNVVVPGAIDDHTPDRDLYLSPLHCMFFNEVLILVMYLVQ